MRATAIWLAVAVLTAAAAFGGATRTLQRRITVDCAYLGWYCGIDGVLV